MGQGSGNLWRRLRRGRRRLMFLGLRTLLRVVGFARARTVGTWLGELQYRFDLRQRLRLQREVALALGRSADDATVPPLLREAYRTNNGAVLEMLAMFDRRQPDDALIARCHLDGLEHLHTAMAEGRGAILLATHSGNTALLTLRLMQAGWPVSVLYRESRMMSAGFLQQGLEQYGIQGILANSGIRAYGQVLSALKQGRIVSMMLDQGATRPQDGSMHHFLGKDMAMPAGPAQLARTSRSPVLPLVMTAAYPEWRYAIQPAVSLTGGSLASDLALLVRLTEQQVRLAPQFWSWHHRRWAHLPTAESPPR